jgi:RNA polymerase II subunit A small phosphatase-like protein
LPPPLPEDADKICLVLDLDETLIHSSFVPGGHADFLFAFYLADMTIDVHCYIRPGAKTFVRELSNLYELVVFTASIQPYADQVCEFIDPDHLIKHKLYRDSCTEFGGNYVKDLGRLNRKLEKIIIVDNSPGAYLFHPYNAIPISSWFDEKSDRELHVLLEFLKKCYRIRNIYDLLCPD